MEHVKVGEFDIPSVGLGTFSLHGDELEKIVVAAIEMGYRYIDTAYRYGNEEDIGRILATQKTSEFTKVLLSSKLSGIQYHGRKTILPFSLNRKKPRKALKESLEKLQRKELDIYMLHSPFKEYQIAYSKLLKERESGRIKVVGVSGFNEEQLRQIKKFCGVYPMVNMIEIHPYHSSKALVSFCRENSIQIIARSPFAHGEILSELNQNEMIGVIAKKYGKTVPQIILRWIIQQGIVVIPRTHSVNHLKANIDIFDFKLNDDEMAIVDSLNRDVSYGVVSKQVLLQ